ncbi:hypothetical protein [Streptomyces sp. NPDC050485]|uniref:hypothetical protein n=1 Tax=Streptomyces sp. NPDC050485 TaxID=3365617 RepID=UPI0037A5DCCB
MKAESAPTRLSRLARQCYHRAESARRLRGRRERQLAAVLQSLDTAPRVGVYALANPGHNPSIRSAAATALAAHHRWDVATTLHDTTGMTDPVLRPGLSQALRRLARDEIHGLVMVSRTDITAFDDLYGEVLDLIHHNGGFLALAHPETTP